MDGNPWELDNLADDPVQAEVLKTMRARLGEWMEATGDQGAEPEGDAGYMQVLRAEKRAYYERRMRRRQLDPDLSDREYL